MRSQNFFDFRRRGPYYFDREIRMGEGSDEHIGNQGISNNDNLDVIHKDKEDRKIQETCDEAEGMETNKDAEMPSRGEIFLERRVDKEQHAGKRVLLREFGPCHRCKAWTTKRQLWRHQRTCIGAKPDSPILPTSQLSTLSDILATRMSVECPMLKTEVLDKLRTDTVGEIIRNDSIILKLGKMWITKNVANVLKRGKYTAGVLRLVGNFVKNYREITGNISISLNDILPSQNHSNIVYGVLATATHDLQNIVDLKAPSNAIKMGFEIKRAISVKIAESILGNRPHERDDAEGLLKVMNIYWPTDVTKLAKNVLLDKAFNKVRLMPDPRDVVKFNSQLNNFCSKIDTSDHSSQNFTYVAEVTGAKATLYNRRRPLEVENLT